MLQIALDLDLSVSIHERRHVQEIFALVDANREHLGTWFDWPAATQAPEDLNGFIEGSLARFARGEGFDGGLRHRGVLVGGLAYHHVNRRVGRTEIGYWLAEQAQGQGLMTRAVTGFLRYLFEDEGFSKIDIRCHPDNHKSAAIARRLGFVHEGTARNVDLLRGKPIDHHIFGLRIEEWRAQNEAQEATA